jgi:hypothetical protein
VISADEESGKVVHVNFVSDELKSRGLDARTWAAKVSEILGGKVSLTTVKFPPLLKTLYFRLVAKTTVLKVRALMWTRFKKLWQ